MPYHRLADAASVHGHFEHAGLVDMLLSDVSDTVVHWVDVGDV